MLFIKTPENTDDKNENSENSMALKIQKSKTTEKTYKHRRAQTRSDFEAFDYVSNLFILP
jgi:hypothetical protein